MILGIRNYQLNRIEFDPRVIELCSPIMGFWECSSETTLGIWLDGGQEGKVKVKSLSHVPLLATTWTAAYQGPPSMGFSRQEYWSGAIAFSKMGHYVALKIINREPWYITSPS